MPRKVFNPFTGEFIEGTKLLGIRLLDVFEDLFTKPVTPFTWTPDDLPNKSLWLRADTLVTESGGRVIEMTDKSGNGRHFTATSGSALRPTEILSALNTEPVVRFDGTNALQYSGANYTGSNSPSTVLIVLKQNTLTTFQGLFTLGNSVSPGDDYTHWLIDPAGGGGAGYGKYATCWGNGSFAAGVSANPTAYFTSGYKSTLVTFAGTSPGNTAQYTFRVAGAVETAFTSPGINNNPTAVTALGFHPNSGGFYFNGDVAEVIVTSDVISASDRTNLLQYLNLRYGI